MALVPHASSTNKEEIRGAIVAVRGAQELTQEEYEQRIKDVRLAWPAATNWLAMSAASTCQNL